MILLTGARGFVGQSVLRQLTAVGYPVQSYQGHIADNYSLRESMQSAETVIHLASAEFRGRVKELQRVDIAGTRAVVQEANRANINHLIFVSRLGANPNSMFAVLRAKGEAEQLVRQSGIPATIVQSATLFGRHDRFLNSLAGLAAWSWPFVWLPAGGHALLQPLWVEDLARILVLLSDPLDLQGYRGGTFAVAGTERLRYEELMRQVLSAAGLSRRPLGVRMPIVRFLTNIYWGRLRRPPVTRFFLDRLAVPESIELDGVRRQFGFTPSRLSEQVSYLRQSHLRWHLWG
jgi:uncharacterized protein YbjT (DUF2867 family)